MCAYTYMYTCVCVCIHIYSSHQVSPTSSVDGGSVCPGGKILLLGRVVSSRQLLYCRMLQCVQCLSPRRPSHFGGSRVPQAHRRFSWSEFLRIKILNLLVQYRRFQIGMNSRSTGATNEAPTCAFPLHASYTDSLWSNVRGLNEVISRGGQQQRLLLVERYGDIEGPSNPKI